jgi:hypothetical protein
MYYRIYSRISREILDKILKTEILVIFFDLFFQFDLYAGRLIRQYIRYVYGSIFECVSQIYLTLQESLMGTLALYDTCQMLNSKVTAYKTY